MYVKSYNQAHGTPTYLGASYRDCSVFTYKKGGTTYYRTQGYIYTINGATSTGSRSDYYTGEDTLDYAGYNSMYCGVNRAKQSSSWWLASPSASYSENVCRVNGDFACLDFGSRDKTYGICPLVSLRSDFTPQISE